MNEAVLHVFWWALPIIGSAGLIYLGSLINSGVKARRELRSKEVEVVKEGLSNLNENVTNGLNKLGEKFDHMQLTQSKLYNELGISKKTMEQLEKSHIALENRLISRIDKNQERIDKALGQGLVKN